MKRFLRDNGLTLVLTSLFLVSIVGQALAGWKHYNQEQQEHGQSAVGLTAYLGSGDFIEATFENWESEFLQMATFLLLTAFLFQRGAAESRDPDADPAKEERKQAARLRNPPPDAPGPVHRGGLALKLYSQSLVIAMTALFVLSFVLHAVGGQRKFNEEAQEHGQALLSLGGYMASSTFWFESFQNWQSEFLSLAAIMVLSIFLRQKGSPESKPVFAPHAETGA